MRGLERNVLGWVTATLVLQGAIVCSAVGGTALTDQHATASNPGLIMLRAAEFDPLVSIPEFPPELS